MTSVLLGSRATSHSHCVSVSDSLSDSLSKIPERETQTE
jgi:hypothetical protein